MIEQRNRFIRDVDLNGATLTHLLDRHDREKDVDVEIPIINHSPFYGESKFADLIKNNAGLSILDLNIQNVYSKFDELICFIQNVKVLEKCTKNLIGHSRLAFNNHESNIDC